MFNFFNRSKQQYPSIRQALVQAGLSAAGDPNRVAVLEKHGRYSGRQVNYFQAFEAGHQDVLLGSGHVERGGVVVVNGRSAPQRAVPFREPAIRADHADDARLVFWDADAALSSEATVSP
jgi:hypothetical protein